MTAHLMRSMSSGWLWSRSSSVLMSVVVELDSLEIATAQPDIGDATSSTQRERDQPLKGVYINLYPNLRAYVRVCARMMVMTQ